MTLRIVITILMFVGLCTCCAMVDYVSLRKYNSKSHHESKTDNAE